MLGEHGVTACVCSRAWTGVAETLCLWTGCRLCIGTGGHHLWLAQLDVSSMPHVQLSCFSVAVRASSQHDIHVNSESDAVNVQCALLLSSNAAVAVEQRAFSCLACGAGVPVPAAHADCSCDATIVRGNHGLLVA